MFNGCSIAEGEKVVLAPGAWFDLLSNELVIHGELEATNTTQTKVLFASDGTPSIIVDGEAARLTLTRGDVENCSISAQNGGTLTLTSVTVEGSVALDDTSSAVLSSATLEQDFQSAGKLEATGCTFKGSIELQGSATLADNSFAEGINVQDSSMELSGSGNTFIGETVLIVDSLTGNLNALTENLAASTISHDNACIRINSVASGSEAVLDTPMSGIKYYNLDSSTIEYGATLTLKRGVKALVRSARIEGKLVCEAGATVVADSLYGSVYVTGGIEANGARFEGAFQLGSEAQFSGNANIFADDFKFLLADFEGDTTPIFSGLTESVFEAGVAKVDTCWWYGDVTLSAIDSTPTVYTYTEELYDYGNTLTVNDGVTLVLARNAGITGTLHFKGSARIVAPEGGMLSYDWESDMQQLSRRALTIQSGATFTYGEAQVAGNLIISSAANVSGTSMTLASDSTLVISLDSWDGAAPALLKNLGTIKKSDASARMLYSINGLAGETVTLDADALEALGYAASEKVVFDTITLQEGNTLVLGAGEELEVERVVTVGTGATLELGAASSLKVNEEKLSVSTGDDMMEGGFEFDPILGLYLAEGATLKLNGAVELHGDLHVAAGASITGGSLKLMGDSRIVLHSWYGSTAELDTLFDTTISYESTSRPIYLRNTSECLELEKLQNGQSEYELQGKSLYFETFRIGEGVTLYTDEVFAPYCDFYDGEGGLVMEAGSRLTTLSGKGALVLSESCLNGQDCQIDTTLYLQQATIAGSGIKLANEHALTFHIEESDVQAAYDSIFSGATLECTNENAYAHCVFGGPGNDEVALDESLIASITPEGCSRLVFSAYDGVYTVADNTSLNVNEFSLSDGGGISFGKSCVVNGVDLLDTVPEYESGVEWQRALLRVNGARITADDTLFNVTLSFNDETEFLGSGYKFGNDIAVQYVANLESDSLSSVSNALSGVDYEVVNPNAAFALEIIAMSDLTLTQEALEECCPAGFAQVKVQDLMVDDYVSIDLAGISFAPSSYIGGYFENLTIRDCSFDYVPEWAEPHTINCQGENTVLDGLNLTHVEVRSGYEAKLEISNCSGAGTIFVSEDSGVKISNCDLSRMTFNFDEVYESLVVDLSGNYWGTTDKEAILERLNSFAAGARGNCSFILDSILPLSPVDDSFSYDGSMLAGLKLREGDTKLEILFSANLDASSLEADTVTLRDSVGNLVGITSVLVTGRKLVVQLDEAVAEGSYTLEVSDTLKDTKGNAFVCPVDGAELAVTVQPLGNVKVLAALFDEAPGCLNGVDVFLNKVVDASLFKAAVVLVDADGNTYSPATVTSMNDGRYFHVVFDGVDKGGSYTLQLDADVDLTSDGDRLETDFEKKVYISSPDLSVAEADTLYEISANQSLSSAAVEYQVKNSGDAIQGRNRQDSVYVCESATWNAAAAKVIARGIDAAGISEGGSRSLTQAISIAGLDMNKTYYVFVKTDSNNSVAETDEENNVSCIGRLVVTADEWDGSLSAEQGDVFYYEYTATEDGTLMFDVPAEYLTVQMTTGGWEQLRGQASHASVQQLESDSRWVFDAVKGITYRFTLTALKEIPAQPVSITKAPCELLSVDTRYVRLGESRFTVTGTNLGTAKAFRLVHEDGSVITCDSVIVKSHSEVELVFNIDETELVKTGDYTLQALDAPAGEVLSALDSTLSFGYYELAVEFIRQSYGFYIREGSMLRMQVECRNQAGGSVASPLVLVHESIDRDMLYYGEVNSTGRESHTARKALLFLADSNDTSPGAMVGGESYTFTFTECSSSANQATHASILAVDDTSTVSHAMWGWLESALRPQAMSDDAWNAWWSSMVPRIGNRVCDVVQFIHSMRDTLASAQLPPGCDANAGLPEMVQEIIAQHPEYAPSCTLSSMIRMSSGEPAAAGMMVNLYEVVEGKYILCNTGVTDADGRVLISGLVPGKSYALGTAHRWATGGLSGEQFYMLPEIAGAELRLELPEVMELVDVGSTISQPNMIVTPEGGSFGIWVEENHLVTTPLEGEGGRTVVASGDVRDYTAIWNDETQQVDIRLGDNLVGIVWDDAVISVVQKPEQDPEADINMALREDVVSMATKKAWDPNDISGPEGVGEQNWVADGVQSYLIRCENDKDKAAASAARVVITQQLDADLDWSTFRIGSMNMGGYYIDVPEGLSSYQARLDWRDTHGLYVDVDVHVDYDTGLVTWSFTGIDPLTGDIPTDINLGLLAPNYESPEGEGWVRYSISPQAGARTSTRVDSKATIVFDWNDPIDTPAIFNTLDKTAPTAGMNTEARRIDARRYEISWQGQDAESGVVAYDIYVSADGTTWEPWATGLTWTSAVFTAADSQKDYQFRVVATDAAGNVGVAGESVLELSHDPETRAVAVLGTDTLVEAGTGFVNGFSIRFNATVELSALAADWADAVSLGTKEGTGIDLSGGVFSYDAATCTLSWHSADPLQAGDYVITLKPGGLQSSAGEPVQPAALPAFAFAGEKYKNAPAPTRSPVMADVDNDGQNELVSGSVDGTLNVAKRNPETTIYEYSGSVPGVDVGANAAPAMVDWNGDGKDDLLIGNEEGHIILYLNQGKEGEIRFGSGQYLLDGAAPLCVPGGNAVFAASDWDGDGLFDIIASNSRDQLLYYRNYGTASNPLFSGYELLEVDGGKLALPGATTTQVMVTDSNQDGVLDLLVGRDNGGVYLLQGVESPLSVIGDFSIKAMPNMDDESRLSQQLRLSGVADGSAIYSTSLTESLSDTDTVDFISVSSAGTGTYSVSLDPASLMMTVAISVGTRNAAGEFVPMHELILAPGAAVATLPGVCLGDDQTLYVKVEGMGTERIGGFYKLNITGTVPAGTTLATQDNNAEEAAESSADGSETRGWVGAGDACDFYRVEMAAAGSLSIGLDELEAAARVRVYEQRADGSLAQLDSRAVKAASGLDATLSLTSGTYFVEVASLDAGAGQYNTAYSLTLEKEEQQAAESERNIMAQG